LAKGPDKSSSFYFLKWQKAPARVDKLGKLAAPEPTLKKLKMTAFSADIAASNNGVPAGLGKMYFVPKRIVSFR